MNVVRSAFVALVASLIAFTAQATAAETAEPLGAADSAAGLAQPSSAPLPDRLDYDPERRIPAGYHLEEEVRKGPFIAGAVGFAGGYAATLGVAIWATVASPTIPYDDAWLYVPVLGPWLSMASLKSSSCSDTQQGANYCGDGISRGEITGSKIYLALLGTVQLSGAALLVISLTAKREYLLRNDLVRASIVPIQIGHNGQGLALTGTFSGL